MLQRCTQWTILPLGSGDIHFCWFVLIHSQASSNYSLWYWLTRRMLDQPMADTWWLQAHLHCHYPQWLAGTCSWAESHCHCAAGVVLVGGGWWWSGCSAGLLWGLGWRRGREWSSLPPSRKSHWHQSGCCPHRSASGPQYSRESPLAEPVWYKW